MNKLKSFIYQVIDEDSKHPLAKKFNLFIIVLIKFNVVAIVLESFEGIATRFHAVLFLFELFSVIIFSLEYLARLWTADFKYPELSRIRGIWRMATSAMAVIDLLAILPFFLPLFFKIDLRFIRMLRLLRLLRILKLGRYSRPLRMVIDVLQQKREELAITLFVTFILLITASAFMYHLENKAQPENFPNIIATFWWAIATLTTVGYGDVYPVTAWGKFVSGIIALLGIGVVALPTGILSSAFIEGLGDKDKEEEDEGENEAKTHKATALDAVAHNYTYCPHCGKKLIDH